MKKKIAPLPKQSPLTAFEKARLHWFEIYGSAVVERNRNFLLSLFLAIGMTAMGVAIYFMLPLKTVVPYVVRVADNGSVTASNAATTDFTPGDKEISYFLVEWTRNLMTLDKQLTEHHLKTAMRRTSGVASSQLTDFVRRTKPFAALSETPDLVRTFEVVTMPTHIADKVAMLRIETVSRNAAKELKRQRYQVTLRYAISAPKTEHEILDNPIGLFITDFRLDELQ